MYINAIQRLKVQISDEDFNREVLSAAGSKLGIRLGSYISNGNVVIETDRGNNRGGEEVVVLEESVDQDRLDQFKLYESISRIFS